MSFSKLCQFLFSMPNGLLTLSWTQWCFIKISVEAGGGGGGGGILLTSIVLTMIVGINAFLFNRKLNYKDPYFIGLTVRYTNNCTCLYLFIRMLEGRGKYLLLKFLINVEWRSPETGSNKLLYPFKMSSVLNVNHSIVRIAFRHFHLNHTDTLRHTATAPKL